MPLTAYDITAPVSKPSLTMIDALLILAGRFRLILSACILGAGCGLAVAVTLHPIYTSSAVIMPPARQQSSLSSLIGQIGAVADLPGTGISSLTNPGDMYVGILKGETIADGLIARFGLRAEYRARTMWETRLALAGHTRFAAGKDTLIRISVDDPDPAKAAAIANGYVEALHDQTVRLALTESGQRRLFFEQQIQEERNRLAEAELAMKRTQETTGLFHLTGQLETTVRAAAEIQAEVTSREVLLERLRTGATAQNPQVVSIETEVSALRSELKKLQDSQPLDSLMPGTRAVPDASLSYLRSMRDLQYHEALFQALAKQYEAAKIDEAKEAPLIQVVDRAVPPDRKSWPPRAAITAFGLLSALLVSCSLALCENHLRTSGEIQKLSRIWPLLLGRRVV